jgi:TrmH family RNA methyltransferase
MTIKIVLVEPSVPGNIGATARIMKNFDFKELVLINPQTELTGESYKFAMNAKDILENVVIFKSLKEFAETVTYIVGTTAKICTDKGSTDARVAVSSNDPSLKNLHEFQDDIALLFGREDKGLTNEEIDFCDMTIHIPTSENYKTLNLAQAVSIILYSLHILKDDLPETKYREANKEEKDMLIEWFGKAVAASGIKDWKADHLVRRFRNIIGRAFVSGKEAHSLVGVFSRTYNRLKELDNEQ